MQTFTSSQQALVDDFNALVAGTSPLDRHVVFERLRAELPIFRSDRLDAWVVSRHRDVKQVLNSGDDFQPPQAGAGASAFGRSFMQMSGREHSKKIGIVAREMRTARAMRERLTGMVQEIAVRQAEGLPMGQPINLREQYATWVPLLAITALTDLPEAARFRDWYRTIVAGGSSSITNPGAREAAFKAREEVRMFLEPIIAQRRQQPGRDLLSDLVTAEYEDAPIPHEEIVSNVIFLLAAGVETTERVLTSVLRHVALDPQEWEWLRANYRDPEALAAFSAEALRLYPPVSAFVRTALRDTELAGTVVRVGDKVLSISASGNCDYAHFADPMQFDHNRFAGNSERQFAVGGDILSFGDGMHHCVGSRLAKVEMAHAFIEFMDRVARIEPVGELPPGEGFIFNSPPTLPVILHPV
jgi:cytochrome P450